MSTPEARNPIWEIYYEWAWDKDFKITPTKIFKILKENINNFINKICKNSNSGWREIMNKVQVMEVEMESLKKTKTEEKLERKNWGS